jgi:zinc protease
LSWRFADIYVESVKAVTAEQVMEVAKKYLVDDRLTVAELEPLPIVEQSRYQQGGR